MNMYNCELWVEDIDRVIKATPWLDQLYGRSVMITGVGGLIGSSIADLLIRLNEIDKRRIRVYAAARSEEKIKKRFGEYFERDYFFYVPFDATRTEIDVGEKVDFIIHGASNASPNHIIKEPVETMMSNFNGLLGLLENGRNLGSERLLLISSSEVYGQKEGCEPFNESDYGYIDLLNSRNSYSIGKRAAETLCASFSDEYGMDTVIVRPGHIYGPTASKMDDRVSSQWPYIAASGEDIIMMSSGEQIRSYCYCLDCASAILTVLLKGEKCHAYNISNPQSIISIRQMAEIIVNNTGVKLQSVVPSEVERKGFNPMMNSSLDGTNLLKLGWKACFDAEMGFQHTLQILKETEKC